MSKMWGGSRPGAGRKKLNKKYFQYKFKFDSLEERDEFKILIKLARTRYKLLTGKTIIKLLKKDLE